MRSKVVNKGFTLVELVIGIVVLAIAMMVMNTMLISQSKDALEPLYRLRASQLGQSIMQNILTRAYDQNSDHNGGYYRCGEDWLLGGTSVPVSCTDKDEYGPEGAEMGNVAERKHPIFNDVDDFIVANFISAVEYGDLLSQKVPPLTNKLPPQYNNYFVKIAVAEDKTTVSGITMKRIDVTIQTPSDEQLVFSALKGNY